MILFFLISGFVLMNIFTKNIYINYSKFIQKRLVRIYIPYISSIVFSIICFLLFANYPLKEAGYWFNILWAESLTIANVFNHMLFIGYYDSNTINGSIWSLVHELRISIIFPILALILLRFKTNIVIYAFFVLVSISSYYIRDEYKPIFITDIMYTLYFIGFFVLGAMINVYKDTVIEYFNLIKPLYKVSIFILSIYLYSYKWSIFPHNAFIHNTLINDLVISIGGSGILIVFLSVQFNKLHKFVYKILLILGDISYSLYLIHLPILLSTVYLFHSSKQFPFILLLTALITIFLSFIFHILVEKKLLNLFYFKLNLRKAI